MIRRVRKRTRFQLFGLLTVALFIQVPAFAKCPITGGSTLIMRVPVGNLVVDTTGTDSVNVQVNNPQIVIEEICGNGQVEIRANVPARIPNNTVLWTIVVPKNVNLDLVTMGGGIRLGDCDANATLRTTGSDVVVGNIRGKTAIVTQGGSIKAGNIGSDAELRSEGGSLEVNDVAGNAEFETAGGRIVAGVISGRINAKTAGGSITVKEARGEVTADTLAGDISIGDAAGVTAKTGGGNITSRRVRGPFKGHTESGDIRIESAGSSIEASTGFGNIFARSIPENPAGDLHMDLQSGVGDVTIYLSQRMKATIEATVEKPAFETQRIFSDFPMTPLQAPRGQGLAPTPGKFYGPVRTQGLLNGGGNRVRLHTSLGTVEIHKQ